MQKFKNCKNWGHKNWGQILRDPHRCGFKDTENLTSMYKEYQNVYESYKGMAIFQREYSRVLSSLRDYRSAINHSIISIDIEADNPLNHYVLADIYFRSKDFKSSSKKYLEMYRLGYASPINTSKKFSLSMHHGMFQSLLAIGDYDEIFSLTEEWNQDNDFAGILGGYRSTAYKRSVENSYRTDPVKYIESMSKSIDIMEDVFLKVGYLTSPSVLSWKIFDEIEYFATRCNDLDEYSDYINKGVNFINKNMSPVLEQTILLRSSNDKTEHARLANIDSNL